MIAPPRGRMLYRRSVERDLVDGRVIHVSRAFTVEFRENGEGFLVHGLQQSVSVEAPETLSRFVELEQSRDESGLFPLELTASGRIANPDNTLPRQAEVQSAVDHALEVMGQHNPPQSEREQVEQFIGAIHAAGQGITATMPEDLFAPSDEPRRTSEIVILPDGTEGSVQTLFEAEMDRATGLMRSAARDIVTAIGSSRRTTRERWTLTALS
ncbi:hypothetical protein [Aurantiacibacter sp. MUD61]|uniref:hypothetical protein n=1 Tax=Aurantiacibacter sp. MUD61 TaxID=3009083 RepID=UPI0022EFF994|nr:hypothetical protein [Aurantiacibacter sp. MUD61]